MMYFLQILANNMLSRIQLTTDDDGHISESTDESAADEDDEWVRRIYYIHKAKKINK